jgi:hypothetical protein
LRLVCKAAYGVVHRQQTGEEKEELKRDEFHVRP